MPSSSRRERSSRSVSANRSGHVHRGLTSFRHTCVDRTLAGQTENSPVELDTAMNAPARRETFLVFGAPLVETAEIDEVVATLRSGWLGTGPKVAQFERDFSAYTGAPHAVAVNSCTAALHLSIVAADLKPGDEVITSPMTFCASANAFIHAGVTPVLVDVDPVTMNIDPAEAAAESPSRRGPSYRSTSPGIPAIWIR